ncbi:hypothetical protein [Pyxidicoccus sp. MSG2]|uniref:hypothetical protein n=1 Tax=Pyxidicoccus sp. MSG2 TaxID=2996790 RepID=UPI00226D5B66|nr:hypothetical protein [Pyxidicoccus sp. MSG2]MCY1019125.1 hypothetical protein [Pyxidicoccus sp. MSG2]
MSTRPARSHESAAHVLEELRRKDLSVERARAIVAGWLKGLVPQAAKGDWQLWCARGRQSLNPSDCPPRALP